MDIGNITHNPAVRKYGLWILGGVVGLYLVYKYLGNSNAAPATAASASGFDPAYAQYALASQTEANNAAQAAAVTNAQATVAETQAVGSTLSQVIQAQDVLPATVINAATADSQTALQGAAQVAAAGVSAVPGSIQASADAIAATEAPWSALAAGEGASTAAAYNMLGTTASESVRAASSSAASSSSASVAANQSSSNTASTIGTIAAIALL